MPGLVVALVLAACGGGDGEGDGALAEAGDWCELARRIEDSDSAFDELIGSDPESVEAAIGELQGLLDEAARAAPDTILADVNISADGVDALAGLLSDAEYDVTRIDEASFTELDVLSTEMDEATARIEEYNEVECGILVDDDVAATDDTLSDEPTGDPDSDWCIAARDVEAASDALDAADFDFTDPESVRSAFSDMLIAFELAIGSAPPEIAADVATSYDGFVMLEAELAKVDYDFLRADLSLIDELDTDIEAASGRIGAYNEAVCGIPDDDADDTTAGADHSDPNDFDPTAGSIRDQTIAEFTANGFSQQEAECMFDNIDFTDPTLGTDMSVIVSVFELCDIDLARLAELAELGG